MNIVLYPIENSLSVVLKKKIVNKQNTYTPIVVSKNGSKFKTDLRINV